MPLISALVLAIALLLAPTASAQEKTDPVTTQAIHELSDKNPSVRAQAAELLGNREGDTTSPDERQAIPALVATLKDSDHTVRMAAAFALGKIGSDGKTVVPALVQALSDNDDSVRVSAADSLGWIHREAQLSVPALATALTDKDSSVQHAAMTAMIAFGRDGTLSLPSLISLVKSGNAPNRFHAVRVLAAIGPDARDAVPLLTAELNDQDEEIRLESAAALAAIGMNQSQALPIPLRLINHEDSDIRCRAVGVLGAFGAMAQSAVPPLTKALNDEDRDVRWVAANSLDRIAGALKEGRATQAAESLRAAGTAMELSADQRVKAHAENVLDAANALEAIRQRNLNERLLHLIRPHPTLAIVVGVYILLASISLALLWLTPLSLLRINEALRPFPKVKLPGWVGGIEISLPYLILVGFFAYGDRVLSAWVARNVEQARADFTAFETLGSKTGNLDLPVFLDGRGLPALSAKDLRGAFAKTKTCVVIWGEEKESKTRLGHQIGRWGMEHDPAKRLRMNLMLPVLIAEDFIYEPGKDSDPFTRTVRDKLRYDGPHPSIELVVCLMESQRILVIVDGFSDLSQKSQSMIRPDSSEFPANALVVTSRVDEKFDGIPITTIRPAEAVLSAVGKSGRD